MSSSVDIECIVVGAGVVGLAIARALAQQGKEVLIVEAAAQFGSGISSRNSEVIHAGLYYPPNSLKAKLCIKGKALLYDFCERRQIPHQRLGKLLVATEAAEIAQLMAIKNNAKASGVHDLVLLQASDIATLEPELHAELALFSPSTGIVDSHALMLALLAEAEHAGAQLVLNTPLKQLSIQGTNHFICSFDDTSQTQLSCANLINASGLYATELAKQFRGLEQQFIPTAHYYCKGRYFSYTSKAPFKHLIYPMPDKDGLGIHLTLDLGGQIKFGPDVCWQAQENYLVEAEQARVFYEAVRRYWPSLQEGCLQPAYAGIRPKLSAAGHTAADFIISTEAVHGISGLVNLFGIESPGLTAALAIADEVANHL